MRLGRRLASYVASRGTWASFGFSAGTFAMNPQPNGTSILLLLLAISLVVVMVICDVIIWVAVEAQKSASDGTGPGC